MFGKVYDWFRDRIGKLIQSLPRIRDTATDRHLRDLDKRKNEPGR